MTKEGPDDHGVKKEFRGQFDLPEGKRERPRDSKAVDTSETAFLYAMGYTEDPPPPPPPPPPEPNTSTAPDEEDDYDPTWGTGDDDEELPDDVIPIHGDSTDPAPSLSESATFAPITSAKPFVAPAWLLPAVVVGLLLLGVVGFAATRGPESSAAPVPVSTPASGRTAETTIAPTAAAAARVAHLTFSIPATANVCQQPVSFTLSV